MIELRFNYNPFNDDFHYCANDSHAISLYNKGKQKNFDEYIRLIIVENTLYIRVYYPFNDIETLNIEQLGNKSLIILKEYENIIIEHLKGHNININKIIYNVDNDLLKGIRLSNI